MHVEIMSVKIRHRPKYNTNIIPKELNKDYRRDNVNSNENNSTTYKVFISY